MDLAVVAATFVAIALVELPDKTFVATLVLATRYRPVLVWIGVGVAFGVQTVVAVTLGGFIARLPRTPVEVAAAALFAIGAVILLRGARTADEDEAASEQEFGGKITAGRHGVHAVVASFLVLFLAEWGDLSQLLTAALVVRYREPGSVFVGAWAALLAVSAAGAAIGRALLKRVRLVTIRRLGAAICAVLAALTAATAAGLSLPI